MLDLRVLEEVPAQIALDEDVSGLELSIDGISLFGQVGVNLDIVGSGNIYYCTGRAECEAQIVCVRCLEPYRSKLCGDVEFSIHMADDAGDVDCDEVPDNELVVGSGAAEVDISGPIREALLLEVPLKPLCSEECRGICPICGTNRNERQCECKVERTDTRWDGLRDIMKNHQASDS